MSPTGLNRPIIEKGCTNNLSFFFCFFFCFCFFVFVFVFLFFVCLFFLFCFCFCVCVYVWSVGAIFQNLSPSMTLKMGLRSPKPNQFFSLSQQYSCTSLVKSTSLVKIHPFILETGVQKSHCSTILSPPVILKMGVNVTII